MPNPLFKASLSAFAAAMWWLADRLWGDRIFNWLRPMIPDWLVSSPIEGATQFLVSYGPPFGFLCLAIYFFILSRQKPKQAEMVRLPQSQQRHLTTETQRKLIELLRARLPESRTVHITYIAIELRSFAEQLQAVFHLLNWQTNMTNLSLNPFQVHHLRQVNGIEISGFNKHTIESVVAIFREIGISDVRQELKQHQIAHDNPKWPGIQTRFEILIGYQS